MDLGATASIFAVVSLAGQLGGGVANLLTFFESFKGAPEYVRGIEKNLKLLLPILEGISFDDPTYDDILQDCNAKIHNLQDIVNQLEPGFASSHRRIRGWTALKTTREAYQIRKFKAVLEEMKSNLIIAILSKQLSRSVSLEEVHDLASRVGQLQEELKQHTGRLSQENVKIQASLDQLKIPHRVQTVTCNSTTLDQLHNHEATLQKTIDRIADRIADPFLRQALLSTWKDIVTVQMSKLSEASTVNDGQPVSAANSHASSKGVATPIYCHVYSEPFQDDPQTRPSKDPARPSQRFCDDSTKPSRPNRRGWGRKYLGTYTSWKETIFGRVYIFTRSWQSAGNDGQGESNDQRHTTETIIRFHPSHWLVKCGLCYGFNAACIRSARGLRLTNLEAFRAVPDSALVFELAKLGSLDAMRALFARGEASILDTDSRGWTPLAWATYYACVPTCKWLLGNGSDRTIRLFSHRQPRLKRESCVLELVAGKKWLAVKYLDNPGYDFYAPSRRLEILQFLRDDIDFSDPLAEVANGWELVLGLIENVRQTDRAMAGHLVQWILLAFQKDLASILQEQPVSMNYVHLWLSRVITLGRLDVVEIIADMIGKQHPGIWTDSTVLHYAILTNPVAVGAYMSLGKVQEAFLLFMTHGVDPHFCTFNIESKRYESTTSLSMENSSSFWLWRTMIYSTGYEIEKFIADELSGRSMLHDEGWESDTLLALFMHDFVPIFRALVVCRDCGETFYFSRENWWMATLRKIRERQPLDLTSAISDIQWKHAKLFDDEVNNAYLKGWVYVRRPSAFDPNLYTDDTRPLGDSLRGCKDIERDANEKNTQGYQDQTDDNEDEQGCDEGAEKPGCGKDEPGFGQSQRNCDNETNHDDGELDYDGDELGCGEAHLAKFKQDSRKGIFAHCHVGPPSPVSNRGFDFKYKDLQWAYCSAEETTCPDCWANLEEELALAREAGTLGMPGAFVSG